MWKQKAGFPALANASSAGLWLNAGRSAAPPLLPAKPSLYPMTEDSVKNSPDSFISLVEMIDPPSGYICNRYSRDSNNLTNLANGVLRIALERQCRFPFLFVDPLGRPPLRPRARAAANPALVRSWIRSRSNSASEAKIWKISLRPGVVV